MQRVYNKFSTHKDLTYHNRQSHKPIKCNKCKSIIKLDTALNIHSKKCQKSVKQTPPKVKDHENIKQPTDIFKILMNEGLDKHDNGKSKDKQKQKGTENIWNKEDEIKIDSIFKRVKKAESINVATAQG